MRFGSLFAGIGGFDLAFERVGMTSEFQVEIDDTCGELLGKRFPGVPLHTDIKDVRGDQFEGIDLLCGGFPCQDISNAGRRAGLAGERSGLWWEYHRLLAEVRPEWCVIENVAGLLSSGGRRDLGAILGALGDLGYGFAYRVLDAQWFGVPQRRRRVFIVGHLGDGRAPARVLLEPESGGGDPPSRFGPEEEVAAPLACRARGGSGYPGTDEAVGNHVVGFHLTQTPIHVDQATPAMSAGNRAGCATMGVLSFAENQRAEVVTAPVTPALSTGGEKPGMGYPAILADAMVRRLTPLECERLQGFPDGWTEGFSDNRRYKMLGNAVAVPVVEWIGRRIMEVAA